MTCITRRSFALALSAPLLMDGALADEGLLGAIRSAGKIKLALEFGRPPWAFKDEALKSTGSDYETAELLAADLKVRLEIVDVTGPNRAAFLQARKADVVLSGFSITPERLKVVDFSRAYVMAAIHLAAPKSMPIRSVADLRGQRVGVTRATTADAEMTRLAKDGGIEVLRFDDEATCMVALASSQIDIAAQEPSTVAAVAKRNPARQIETKFVLKQFPVGIGMRKDEPALKAWLDQWVTANLDNGKLNAIYRKFHGADLPAELFKSSTT